MTQSSITMEGAPHRSSPRLAPARLFYTASAVVMLVFGAIGFSRFYLHGMAYPNREIPPPIRTVVVAHGVAMSAWLVFMVIQPALVAAGRRRLHMTLGPVGAALAGVILILGNLVSIRSAQVTPPDARIWGLPPKEFMAVPFACVWLFAIFVALGIAFRRKPDVHRPMMLLGTLSALVAAISRIDPLNSLYVGTVVERVLGPFFFAIVFGALLLAIRSVLARRFDRWFAIGLLALTVISAGTMAIAPTEAWRSLASALTGT